MSNFFSDFYDVIFCPNELFKRLKAQPNVKIGALIISGIAVFNFLLTYNFEFQMFDSMNFLSALLWKVMSSLAGWFLLAKFIDIIGQIFINEKQIAQLLSVLAYAGLPWVFLAPLELLKNVGNICYIFGVLTEFILLGYIILLYIRAVKIVYNLNLSKALSLMCLPLIGGLFAIAWTIGFFSKLAYMFSR